MSAERKQQTMGDRIRDRRIELELTQEELAFEMGIGQDGVSKLETRGTNSIRALERVARALDDSPARLAWGDSWPLGVNPPA